MEGQRRSEVGPVLSGVEMMKAALASSLHPRLEKLKRCSSLLNPGMPYQEAACQVQFGIIKLIVTCDKLTCKEGGKYLGAVVQIPG